MKPIRWKICLFCIMLTLFCSSCGLFSPQSFFCDADTVKSAKIIRLEKYNEHEREFDYTLLSDITDVSDFVKRLNEVDHSVNWGDPGCLTDGYIVIRIDYVNGDYDLIYPSAQWFNRSGENKTGYFFFDKEQFDKLISDYFEIENTTSLAR